MLRALRIVLVAAVLSVAALSMAVADGLSDAVATVEARRDGNSRDCGNGVCVATRDGWGLLVTCHHVIDGRDTATVTFPNRKRFRGTVVAIDKARDLAAVLIRCVEGIPTVPVAETELPEGGDVTLVGDWPEADQPIRRGKRIEDVVAGTPFRLQVDIGVGSGDSGGGLFNTKGELVGVMSGFWPKDVKHQGVGPDAAAVRALLAKVHWPAAK